MLSILEKLIRHTGVFCLAVLFLLMLVQVILRYGFDYTHFATEELGRYLLIWATLAGMALETRQNTHIRVSFIAEKLPERVRRFWQLLLDVASLFVFALLIYTGIDSMLFNHGQESPGLQIPLSLPFSAIPLFFFFALLFMCSRIFSRDKG
ncbi:MAG: TRAP transporter small permease subunit [Gammaproteobacteria bacterium]|nr:TRAP transporter small permease subunit [Gammaproteobacteria bacterium]